MREAVRAAWACAVLAALVLIAFSTSYESTTLGGGARVHAKAILVIIAAAALVGFVGGFVGSAVGSSQRRVRELDDGPG